MERVHKENDDVMMETDDEDDCHWSVMEALLWRVNACGWNFSANAEMIAWIIDDVYKRLSNKSQSRFNSSGFICSLKMIFTLWA